MSRWYNKKNWIDKHKKDCERRAKRKVKKIEAVIAKLDGKPNLHFFQKQVLEDVLINVLKTHKLPVSVANKLLYEK